MKELFLALVFLIIVPSLALAAGKKVACTEMSLHSSYLQKQQQGQKVTHLQQKSAPPTQ